MPIATSSRCDSAAPCRSASSSAIVDSPPSRLKRFWPTYFVCRKVALHRILDVHVLDADRAAVRVAQHAEDLAQERRAAPAEASRDELTVEIPEGQAVARDVEIGVRALLVLERVDVGHEVAAHPVGVDELLHAGGLVDGVGEVDVDVGGPVDRLVRDAEGGEDALVESALPDEQLVYLLEELARAGALDDAVVVGRGEGDGLADTELGEGGLRHALELGRVLEGARADDAPLPAHEPRDGVLGADAARVRERDGGSGEVAGGELVVACLTHDGLVLGNEVREPHRLGLLDAGNE